MHSGRAGNGPRSMRAGASAIGGGVRLGAFAGGRQLRVHPRIQPFQCSAATFPAFPFATRVHHGVALASGLSNSAPRRGQAERSCAFPLTPGQSWACRAGRKRFCVVRLELTKMKPSTDFPFVHHLFIYDATGRDKALKKRPDALHRLGFGGPSERSIQRQGLDLAVRTRVTRRDSSKSPSAPAPTGSGHMPLETGFILPQALRTLTHSGRAPL